jgi:transcriptional regulator with XRE-family HTH domain
MTFKSSKLKKCREEKHLSQSDLVFELAKMGFRVSRPTIENWETGRTIPDADKIALLAHFFKKPITHFFSRRLDKPVW